MDIYVSYLFNKQSNNTERIENDSSLTGCLLFHLDNCKISESFLVYLCTQTLLEVPTVWQLHSHSYHSSILLSLYKKGGGKCQLPLFFSYIKCTWRYTCLLVRVRNTKQITHQVPENNFFLSFFLTWKHTKNTKLLFSSILENFEGK